MTLLVMKKVYIYMYCPARYEEGIYIYVLPSTWFPSGEALWSCDLQPVRSFRLHHMTYIL